MPGTLTIRPLAAKLTRDTEIFGQMDPYCKITFGKQKVQGSVCKNGGKHPHWEDTLTLRRNNEPNLEIEIKEKDWLLPDGTIGTCLVNLREVEAQQRVLKWYPVSFQDKPAGQILIEATFDSDHSIPRNQPAQPRALPVQQPVVNTSDIPHVLPGQEPEYSADIIRGERSGDHHEPSQQSGSGGMIHGWNPFNPANNNQQYNPQYYQPQNQGGQSYAPPSNDDDNSQKYPMFNSQENQRYYENQYQNYQDNQRQVIDYRDNNAPQQNYNPENNYGNNPQNIYTNEPLSEQPQRHYANQVEIHDFNDPLHQVIRGAYYKGTH